MSKTACQRAKSSSGISAVLTGSDGKEEEAGSSCGWLVVSPERVGLRGCRPSTVLVSCKRRGRIWKNAWHVMVGNRFCSTAHRRGSEPCPASVRSNRSRRMGSSGRWTRSDAGVEMTRSCSDAGGALVALLRSEFSVKYHGCAEDMPATGTEKAR